MWQNGQQIPGQLGRGHEHKHVASEELAMEALVLNVWPQVRKKFGGEESGSLSAGMRALLRLGRDQFPIASKAVVEAAKRGLSLIAQEVRLGNVPVVMIKTLRPCLRTAAHNGGAGGDDEEIVSEVDLMWCSEAERLATMRDHGSTARTAVKWSRRWLPAVQVKMPWTTATVQAVMARAALLEKEAGMRVKTSAEGVQ